MSNLKSIKVREETYQALVAQLNIRETFDQEITRLLEELDFNRRRSRARRGTGKRFVRGVREALLEEPGKGGKDV